MVEVLRKEPVETRVDSAPRVRSFSDAIRPAWDAFVAACPEATFFHKSGWKDVLEEAFGHGTYYLYAEQDGEITGVLPLGHIKSALFGNALVSNPFCVYGGPAAVTDTAREALLDAAESLAIELNVDHLELRNLEPSGRDWHSKDLYVTFIAEIDPDQDANLKRIPRKQRAMVRKGMKAGLRGEIDGDLQRFFSMYATSVRNLGTPVFGKRYFDVLARVFADESEILTITHEGRPVSSVFSFYFRDQVLPYYGGGTAEARNTKANDFMYWELMRRAAERGIRWFDYGRSKQGTGSYAFKKNWGFEPRPLAYEYRLVRASEVPEINPLNPRYRMFIKAWQRLPLPIANALGPLVARNLG